MPEISALILDANQWHSIEVNINAATNEAQVILNGIDLGKVVTEFDARPGAGVFALNKYESAGMPLLFKNFELELV